MINHNFLPWINDRLAATVRYRVVDEGAAPEPTTNTQARDHNVRIQIQGEDFRRQLEAQIRPAPATLRKEEFAA